MSIFRFVRIPHAMDYVLLGWLPHPSLDGTRHGRWSVLFEWIDCSCGRQMKEPKT